MDSKLKSYIINKIQTMNFDSIGVGIIDFENQKVEAFEYSLDPLLEKNIYFDLASLTKPLTLGAAYLNNPTSFDEDMLLLLEHRGGLPKWGRLSVQDWKEQIKSYTITESDVNYSDFSAIRLQLELERVEKKSLEELASFYWDGGLSFWKNVSSESSVVSTGTRKGREIRGSVHDDNSFIMNQFTSHAGLFGTVNGLAKSLLDLNDKVSLLKKMKNYLENSNNRFVKGWDRVENLDTTLAGEGADLSTFGHLGFTGTSLWISPIKMKGYFILTNETKGYWYDREKLNNFRKELGAMIWNSFS